jgi:hypothetical protein
MELEPLRYPFSVTQYFIPEFISRMRRSRDILEKPSPRQSIAMCSLLLPAYLRKGHISFGDLIRVAVNTSKVENQATAEKIAYEILLDIEEPVDDQPKYEGEAFLGLLSEKSDDLITYLPSELSEVDKGDPYPRLNSDVDMFKELSGKPDIGVGPGEDEFIRMAIRSWKRERDEISRRNLAEFLKMRLLKLGREFERNLEYLHRTMLRPFEVGDDPELIDEDRSIENIFDQGKSMEEVRYDDFLVKKRDRKRRAIAYILDISNTMFYEMEGLTSVQHSVISLVPLMWGLRRDKYGLILYESNSHVRKGLMDESDIDELIDDLLMVLTSSTSDVEKGLRGTKGSQTWGGTVPNKSLRWALDQLEGSGDRFDKICFYFSDFVLEEPDRKSPEKMENYQIVERMIDRGIRVVACVSPLAWGELFQPYTSVALRRMKDAGAKILETNGPAKFLDGVQSVLE